MSKKLYIYQGLEVCDPTNTDAYHSEGGLIVITSGYPEDAVPRGTGNALSVEHDGEESIIVGLPAPDLTISVGDEIEDVVIPFPDSGCC